MSPHERGFEEMRTPSGKLLAEIDPKRLLIRVKVGPRFELIDLTEFGIRPDQGKQTGLIDTLSEANVLFQRE